MASTKHRRTAPQGSDLYKGIVLVNQLSALADELVDDHATFKTAADETETLVEELHDDHATFKTVVTDLVTAVNAVITAAATSLAAIAAVTPVSSSAPATLTAPKPSSAPATLTAAGTGGDQVLDPGGTAFTE